MPKARKKLTRPKTRKKSQNLASRRNGMMWPRNVKNSPHRAKNHLPPVDRRRIGFNPLQDLNPIKVISRSMPWCPIIQSNPIQNFGQFHETMIAHSKHALANCFQSHRPDCPEHPFDSSNFLPTRLLDLENLEVPKLIISANISSVDQRYVCLSHQWGNPCEEEKLAMTTITSNLQMRLDGFDLWSLPKRYQDAIMICQLLGIRYIWIDSLCIIQDLPQDWRHQAAMMARVYECGFLTISSNMPIKNQCWRPPADESNFVSLVDQNNWLERTLLHGPLAKRAWCLQERYLSPRVLHIFEGSVWIWECNSLVSTVCQRGSVFRRDIVECNDVWRKRVINDSLGYSDLLELWYRIVSDFSNRRLSYQSDKLPAISAIAAKLQPRLNSRYLAGVWENDLYGLLWVVENLTNGVKKPSFYRAPSWSWASVDSSIKFHSELPYKEHRSSLVFLASIKDSNIVVNEEEPFGQVAEGSHITLYGYSCDQHSRMWYFEPYFDESYSVSGSIHYFVICYTVPFNYLVGLILSLVGPNTFKRIGLFEASLDPRHNNSSGSLQVVMFAVFVEELEIILI